MRMLTDVLDECRAENRRLTAALESIANNSCCGPCLEAGKVARAALGGAVASDALRASHQRLREALALAESVYRLNVVAPGEPSSVLDAMQLALKEADQIASVTEGAASNAGGWRAIETAPRDGSEVLLCEASAKRIARGWFDPEITPGWIVIGGKWVPTHWQPLPSTEGLV